MKSDIFRKLMLTIIAILLIFNFLQGGIFTPNAEADKTGETGRYQISSWAAQVSTGYHHSGYYIVDTVTGKVVESKSETHTSKK